MVLDKLGDSLKRTLSKITNSLFVDEKLINELIKDIQRALLHADVNVKLVFELTKKIKERALNEKLPAALSKKEQIINIVYGELVNFLGEEERPIKTDHKPTILMLVGLFGNGKTTTCGKLAKYYTKRGSKTALIQLDVHRPAAYEQLSQIGKQINVDVFGEPGGGDALEIYKKYQEKLNKYDLIIVDTAGRDALSDDLITELESLNDYITPHEVLLIMGADVGQTAMKQALGFKEAVNITGVIITKLDGTAKGGGALAACSVTGAPVRLIGVGEKLDDLEPYDPHGFVGRILGMGDIKALLDKAKNAISEEDAQDLGQKFLKGEFNLIDLYEQMQAIKKMGPLTKVMEMIPGMSQANIPKEIIEGQQGKIESWRYIMDSCTKEELEDPSIIHRDRAERIAKGSGCSISEVRDLLKHYKQSRKLMKAFKGKKMDNMGNVMKQMGGLMGKVRPR
ncbi:signal recognition particle protein Srp54 [Candidatus Woesearchaeota archaeon]|nr:signal recognition particle protein Srp54 [Candidatus Woesearchaeota archaeon]